VETTRFILLVSLGLVLVMLWQAWEVDYGKSAQQKSTTPRPEPGPVQSKDVPQTPLDSSSPKPDDEQQPSPAKGEVIAVSTDEFNIEINTFGGGINLAELKNYPISLDQQDKPVQLLFDDGPSIYIVQGGLLSKGSAPTHENEFSSTQQSYALEPGSNVLNVPLYWNSDEGIRVKKNYQFHRGEYVIKISYEIENNSTRDWEGRAYGQIQRTDPGTSRYRTVYTYTGAVISGPEKRYEKIGFDDMRDEKLTRNITNGWLAMIQHYFMSALVPGSKSEQYHYYTSALDNNRYAVGAITPAVKVKPGESNTINHLLYIGPKIQDDLKKLAPSLELTVDYGVLWFLAKPLFWCLQKFYVLTGNWGWAIILVTLMLKIGFYKLSAAGYRSMANMRQVQPRLLALRERYKNDRARLNQAMMDIYKKEKINPLGGCFPILVQIPVFIALYWVLLESVELRQAGFILWLKDLSGPDPYFVLPIVMGATMLIQQKLNPAPMDPVQEKVMMVLPIVFTVFFAFFPSGLVLYWVVNNILSVAQQWLITRNIERAALKS